MDTLGRIIELLERNGIEQQEFAGDLGLGKTVVSEWRRGKSKSYMKNLKEISDYFNVSLAYLYCTTNDPINYDDPELIAEHYGPVLEHFKGDMKKTIEFQNVVAADAARDNIQPIKKKLRSAARLEELELSEDEDQKIRSYIDFLMSQREANDST